MWISPGTCGRGFLSVWICAGGFLFIPYASKCAGSFYFVAGLSSFVRDTLHETCPEQGRRISISNFRPKASVGPSAATLTFS